MISGVAWRRPSIRRLTTVRFIFVASENLVCTPSKGAAARIFLSATYVCRRSITPGSPREVGSHVWLKNIGCNGLRDFRKINIAELVRTDTYRKTILMRISKFARSACPIAAAAALATVPPPTMYDMPVIVPPGMAAVPDDPFGAGCRFHHLLRRMSDTGPLSSEEKTYLPWLSALRTGLRAIGARRIEPEVPLHRLGSVPAGICDLRVAGGPASRGIVEVKVVTELPTTAPRTKDIVQLSAYVALSRRPWRRSSVWGAIAYVSFRDRVVRLFVFEDAASMEKSAERLFAAAA